MSEKHPVIIIGGGIIGSSAAYFLAHSGRDISVTVSTYTYATTP
jgi:glycine/D-amino acid oxidase-like deaminating enzyme